MPLQQWIRMIFSRRSPFKYGGLFRRSGRSLPLPRGYIVLRSTLPSNGQGRNENIIKLKQLIMYSTFYRTIRYRLTNDSHGFMKKFKDLMKLIAPLHYCCWIILATKKWLTY